MGLSDSRNEEKASVPGSYGFRPGNSLFQSGLRSSDERVSEARSARILTKSDSDANSFGNTFEGELLFWLDAIGVGAFAVGGARNAAAINCHPLICCIAGVMTACGGG